MFRNTLAVMLMAALVIGPTVGLDRTRTQAAIQPVASVQNQPKYQLSQEQWQAFEILASQLTEVDFDEKAVPTWLAGDLGYVKGEPPVAAIDAMKSLGVLFRQSKFDHFEPRKDFEVDQQGQTHVRLQQRYNRLRVIGGDLIVHLEKDHVVGVNGLFVADIAVETRPSLSAKEALSIAVQSIKGQPVPGTSDPELLIFTADQQEPQLAWSQLYSYLEPDGALQRDLLFADAHTGKLLGRHAQIKAALYRRIYDAHRGTLYLPGTLLYSEGGSTAFLDEAGSGALNGTGLTYRFYREVFGRDSYDDDGSDLVSSVHYGRDFPNAFWDDDRRQMFYGDGNGTRWGQTATSLDITAHELTHGVTSSVAGLFYEKESGALDEAFADIMAMSVSAYHRGAPDWLIAEDAFTPGMSGDALRYMNDPMRDGRSADHYPERLYADPSCVPDPRVNDNCGVHTNSGIPNLAFYLMVAGGTHPRGKTSIEVQGIGIEKAQRIWYEALRYLSPRSGFQTACNATIKKAEQLYGVCSQTALNVRRAWEAVGIGSSIVILVAKCAPTGPPTIGTIPIPRPTPFRFPVPFPTLPPR